MREVATVTCVYPFNQLEEDIQDKVLEKLWDINVDWEWWDYDGLFELTEKEIENSNLTEKEIKYLKDNLLFNCILKEFDIDRNRHIKVDLSVTNEEIFRKFLGISSELWENCYYQFIIGHGRYGNTYFEITNDFIDMEEFSDNDISIIKQTEELMNDKIQNALSQLDDSYEYLTSSEAIIETIEANEFEFTKNGKLF